MMNRMGCEAVSMSHIKYEGFRRFLKSTDLEIINVPVRMNGLTSSGSKGKCYQNVANLVEVFGGKVVVGWYVSQLVTPLGNNKRCSRRVSIELHGHAVWLNDENKLSDPTAKNWVTLSKYDPKNYDLCALSKVNNDYFTRFIPLKVGSVEDCYGCESIILECIVDSKGKKLSDWCIHIMYSQQGDYKSYLKWDAIKNELIEEKIIFQFNWQTQFPSWHDYRDFARREGKFSVASSSTGRTLDEIRLLRSNRYAA